MLYNTIFLRKVYYYDTFDLTLNETYLNESFRMQNIKIFE